jgi:3-dehydroquinate synthetase
VGLPVKGLAVDPVAVVEALSRDKKRRDGRVSFVLAPTIGSFQIVQDVPPDAVRQVLQELV